MEEEKFELDISIEKSRFKSHLEIENNNQIIFSGIFGIGKTYFLNKFFEEEKENYESIVISPVNYSISNNEDILDYIKYDIIFQLLTKGIDFEKTDFSKGLTSQMYIKENFLEVMKILAENASKINRQFGAIFNSLNEINKGIEKHNNLANVDEEKELIDFLTTIKDKEGSIYEENRITILISKLIDELKKDGKEVVLIIDDTDRLDPEHVFRIFNVFACHFEFNKFQENKFNFDRIILVCDIDNIRKMFHSKYGQDVDFSGYIDKFYAREIYVFSNKEIIVDSINSLLDSVKRSDSRKLFLESKNWVNILRTILYDMVMTNSINLRNLLKINNTIFDFGNYRFSKGDIYSIATSNQYNLFLIFDFLIFILGSKVNLELSLKNLIENTTDIYLDRYSNNKYGDIIVFLEFDKHESKISEYIYENEKLDLKVSYELQHHHLDNKFYALINEIKDFEDKNKSTFPLYKLLVLGFYKYKKIKISS